jgi:hypothetical protein
MSRHRRYSQEWITLIAESGAVRSQMLSKVKNYHLNRRANMLAWYLNVLVTYRITFCVYRQRPCGGH